MGFIKYLLYAIRKEGWFFWAIIFAMLIAVSMKFAPLIIIPIIVLFRAYQNFLSPKFIEDSGLFEKFILPLLIIFSPGAILLLLNYIFKKTDDVRFSPEFLIVFLILIVIERIFPGMFFGRRRSFFLGRYGEYYFDLKSQKRMEDYYYEKRQEAKYRK